MSKECRLGSLCILYTFTSRGLSPYLSHLSHSLNYPILLLLFMLFPFCNIQSERRHGQHERCTCPDPALPLLNPDKEWKKHHAQLVDDAKKAPKNLDVVFLGDAVIELWNGTKDLGKVIQGMREPFEERFTKVGGDTALAGLALGSSVDTVRTKRKRPVYIALRNFWITLNAMFPVRPIPRRVQTCCGIFKTG
jgi:hypothetical protein